MCVCVTLLIGGRWSSPSSPLRSETQKAPPRHSEHPSQTQSGTSKQQTQPSCDQMLPPTGNRVPQHLASFLLIPLGIRCYFSNTMPVREHKPSEFVQITGWRMNEWDQGFRRAAAPGDLSALKSDAIEWCESIFGWGIAHHRNILSLLLKSVLDAASDVPQVRQGELPELHGAQDAGVRLEHLQGLQSDNPMKRLS